MHLPLHPSDLCPGVLAVYRKRQRPAGGTVRHVRGHALQTLAPARHKHQPHRGTSISYRVVQISATAQYNHWLPCGTNIGYSVVQAAERGFDCVVGQASATACDEKRGHHTWLPVVEGEADDIAVAPLEVRFSNGIAPVEEVSAAVKVPCLPPHLRVRILGLRLAFGFLGLRSAAFMVWVFLRRGPRVLD